MSTDALAGNAHAPAIDRIESAFQAGGPTAAIAALVDDATRTGEPRTLLDALLLKARHELGLPLIAVGSLSEIPEPTRTLYEERYIDALRRVGQSLLDQGQVIAACPYFRAIGEMEPVAKALESNRPPAGDERIGELIDVALYQGANPAFGFSLILEHYGTCSAISAFEQLPPDNTVRGRCAAELTRTLYQHLAANLRAEIVRAGQGRPSDDTPIPALLAARDWLFADENYHIDVSHLASVVRLSPLLNERPDQVRALELCEYGRRLSSRLRYDDHPPFEKTYEDHAAYLNVLLGREVDKNLAHFRAMRENASDSNERMAVAQVLVRLLSRLGRWDEAIDVAAADLADVPEGMLDCDGLARLCQRSGRLDRLAAVSRERGHLVNFAASILQGSSPRTS
jgi:hypothetical protein